MSLRIHLFFALLGCVGLSGCGSQEEAPLAAAPASARHAPLMEAKKEAPAASFASESTAPVRYLALRYKREITLEGSQIESRWQAAVMRCEELGCNLLESRFERPDADTAPTARLHARIAPERRETLFAQAGQGGDIVSDTVSSEDKTYEIIDTDARLKNLTDLRARLRQLLATPGARLKDVLETERELARVQSELDTYAGMRKTLAEQTEKNEITLTFTARRSPVQRDNLSPLRHAWNSLGQVFAESLAALLQFIVAAAPWGLLAALAWLPCRRYLRHRKARASLPPEP